MHLALIYNSRVQGETDAATAALKKHDGEPFFDVRDVSDIPGIDSGWLANEDGTYTEATWPKPRSGLFRLLKRWF